jgi:wyosine [tRNA(Phe)-imidazoG37] synthetase (radical SAM superfamily)
MEGTFLGRRWGRAKRAIRDVAPAPLWRGMRTLKRSARDTLLHHRSHDWLLRHLPTSLSDAGLLSTLMERFSKEEIARAYAHDPWLGNYFVNIWEYSRGEAVLASHPWNVTVPIADVCNARCTFCTSWLEGTRVLALEEVPQFSEVLRFARQLGIAGHGEPLAHPQCEEIFARMSEYVDPRCESYVITNGVFLEQRLDALRKINVTTFNISLNAVTPETHERVMGLGTTALPRILSTIEGLVRARDSGLARVRVTISFVINRDNVHELAEFVRLGNRLRVDTIYLRTLMPVTSLPWGLNYHTLPPYRHPNFTTFVSEAKRAIASSRVQILADVKSWEGPVLTPADEENGRRNVLPMIDRRQAATDPTIRVKYATFYEDQTGEGRPLPDTTDPMDDGTNPYGRAAHYRCSFVYHDFIVNDFNMRLIPCCYMSHVPGFEVVRFDGTRPFLEYWNSPAFVTLRRRLKEGPLFGACRRCPAQ